MEKFHVAAELPFKCGCCDHMSSSQRYTIDHFYTDHTASGALQCPHCLKIFIVVGNNEQLVKNVESYYDHLKLHRKASEYSCSKCSLRFVSKGTMKAHRLYDHNSHTALQRYLRELVKDSTSITRPKVCFTIICCRGNCILIFPTFYHSSSKTSRHARRL